MNLTQDVWSGWQILAVDGDFNLKSLISVKKTLDELSKNPQSRVAIDLSKVTFIDSTAIQLMINYQKQTVGKGGKFKIISPSEDALEILKMLCINELIEICLTWETFKRTC